MTTSTRCLVRLSLLVVLVTGVAGGAWASNPNDIPAVPSDSYEVTRDHEQGKAYVSPMVVPAASFIDDGINPDGFFFPFGGGYIYADAGDYFCAYGVMYLPTGATITSFYANVYDNSTSNLTVNLQRVSKDTGVVETMATVASNSEDTAIHSLVDGTIDNPVVAWQYSYYVIFCMSENLRLYNVRAYYSE